MFKKFKLLPFRTRICAIVVTVFITVSLIIALTASPNTEKIIYGENSAELSLVETDSGKFSYINESGEITYAADKSYATLQQTYDSQGRIIKEIYFDDDDRTCSIKNGAYGYETTYEENRTTKTWLDAKGDPFKITSGYATSVTTKNGTTVETRYYDAKMQPIKQNNDYWGYNDLLDEKGNVVSRTYVDLNGKPIDTKSGYARFARTYDDKKRVLTETYFKADDTLAKLSEGQSGYTYTYDARNRVEETRLLDENGNVMTGTNGYAVTRKTYDAYGRTAILTYLDVKGSPVSCKNGYTFTISTYYDDNTLKTVMYQDTQGKPVQNQSGTYGILYLDEISLNLNADGSIAFSINKLLRLYPISVPLIALLINLMAVGCYLARIKEEAKTKGLNLQSILRSNWMKWLLIMTSFFIIVYETLHNRVPSEHRVNLNLFWSYAKFFSSPESRLQILNNIWLFVPLGSCMILTKRPKRNLILIPLTTLAVESIQFFTATGLAELDDVFHNTLGGLMGFFIAATVVRIIILSNAGREKTTLKTINNGGPSHATGKLQ